MDRPLVLLPAGFVVRRSHPERPAVEQDEPHGEVVHELAFRRRRLRRADRAEGGVAENAQHEQPAQEHQDERGVRLPGRRRAANGDAIGRLRQTKELAARGGVGGRRRACRRGGDRAARRRGVRRVVRPGPAGGRRRAERLQRGGHLVGRRRPVLLPLRHKPANQLSQRRRRVGPLGRQVRRRLGAVADELLRGLAALVGRATREDVVERRAEGVDVGTDVHVAGVRAPVPGRGSPACPGRTPSASSGSRPPPPPGAGPGRGRPPSPAAWRGSRAGCSA